MAEKQKQKEFLFKLLLVAFGIFLSVLATVVLNFALDIKSSSVIKSYIGRNSKLDISLQKYLAPVELTVLIPESPIDKDEALYRSFDIETFQTRQTMRSSGQIERLVKTVQKENNQTLLETKYTTDQLWRRLSPGQQFPRPKKTAVLYIGCSYTWGEGVQDNETFVAYMKKKMPDLDHINLGLPSLGLNDIYAQLGVENYRIEYLKNDFDPKIRYFQFPYEKIILVYLSIADHLYRAQCSQRCYDPLEKLVREKPFFEVKGEELIFRGSHQERYNSSLFPKFFATAGIVRLFDINVPAVNTEENIHRHHLFLKKIKEMYAQHFEVVDSYSIYSIFDDYRFVNSVEVPNYDHGFRPIIFDRRKIFEKYGLSSLVVPYDGHPSPLMNRLTAEALTWRISQDHSELVH